MAAVLASTVGDGFVIILYKKIDRPEDEKRGRYR